MYVMVTKTSHHVRKGLFTRTESIGKTRSCYFEEAFKIAAYIIHFICWKQTLNFQPNSETLSTEYSI